MKRFPCARKLWSTVTRKEHRRVYKVRRAEHLNFKWPGSIPLHVHAHVVSPVSLGGSGRIAVIRCFPTPPDRTSSFLSSDRIQEWADICPNGYLAQPRCSPPAGYIAHGLLEVWSEWLVIRSSIYLAAPSFFFFPRYSTRIERDTGNPSSLLPWVISDMRDDSGSNFKFDLSTGNLRKD